jgi:spermidine/putrescine transport system ATP-binding protein
VRFCSKKGDADNVLTGKIYNEYALGSRIQYQVRAGGHIFVVEKLREQTAHVNLDSEVLIGWDARDSVLVGE